MSRALRGLAAIFEQMWLSSEKECEELRTKLKQENPMTLQKSALDYIHEQQEKKMTLHETTFDYLKPTDEQMGKMNTMRGAAQMYARMIDTHVPDGPDKTYTMRKLREVAMWVNVAITRHPDGAAREPMMQPEYPPEHPAPGDLGSVPL